MNRDRHSACIATKISTKALDKAVQDQAKINLYLFMLKLLWNVAPLTYNNVPAAFFKPNH